MLKGNRFTQVVCLTLALAAFAVLSITIGSYLSPAAVKAQQPVPDNQYLKTSIVITADGKSLTRYQINGPSKPPKGYELERQPVNLSGPNVTNALKTLAVPAYDWVFGCSAVSSSMIAAYYDRTGYSNIYTGPTGGGIMPMDSSVWGTWYDSAGDPYPNNPLIASHKGVDGRITNGSIDDFWVEYGTEANDPYVTNGWSQHAWGDAIGDYMRTSQKFYTDPYYGYVYNTDGSTVFYNYTDIPDRLTCSDMESYDSGIGGSIADVDGTYGRKRFYEQKGYRVTDCYNQPVDTTVTGGFSFAQYKAQIDVGRPVLLNLAGHSIVGVGYDDSYSPPRVYIHDTWDYYTHSMDWGGSYSGMQMLSVSIVNISDEPPAIQDKFVYVPFTINSIIYTGKVTDNGKAVANVPLTLWYSTDGGSNYSAYTTAKTASDGSYIFNTPPVENSDQRFIVEFYNSAKVASRLAWFDCNTVTTSNKDYTCNINLHDMPMGSPANYANISPVKVKFSWARRATSNDSYSWYFYDAKYDDYYYYTNMGYITGFTNTFYYFDTGMNYQWWLGVDTPDGFGIGYYYRWLGFSSVYYGSPSLGAEGLSLNKSETNGKPLTMPASVALRDSGKFLPLMEDAK